METKRTVLILLLVVSQLMARTTASGFHKSCGSSPLTMFKEFATSKGNWNSKRYSKKEISRELDFFLRRSQLAKRASHDQVAAAGSLLHAAQVPGEIQPVQKDHQFLSQRHKGSFILIRENLRFTCFFFKFLNRLKHIQLLNKANWKKNKRDVCQFLLIFLLIVAIKRVINIEINKTLRNI